jgi:hypothetical protein
LAADVRLCRVADSIAWVSRTRGLTSGGHLKQSTIGTGLLGGIARSRRAPIVQPTGVQGWHGFAFRSAISMRTISKAGHTRLQHEPHALDEDSQPDRAHGSSSLGARVLLIVPGALT